MGSNLSVECLDAFPEPLLVVMRSGRIDAANVAAADLLCLVRGFRPEVTFRELAGLSAAEFDDLLRYCFSHNAPVPLRLSFFPVGRAPLDLRCEGWRCTLFDESAAMLRIFDEDESSSRFSELTSLVTQLTQECMARRHSQIRLRKALAQLHDINSIRDHMLAQVSHDLRTPLNAILGMSEFMQEQPFGPLDSRYREYVDDIHTSGGILLQLVDRVLNLAWAEAHSREVNGEALADLGECLETCRRVVEPIARLRGLQIIVPRGATMPKLRADRLLVKQILMNLLGNAAKHTARGGHIEVKLAWRNDNELAIQVKDDGPGIPKEKLAAINGGAVASDPYVAENAHAGFGLALSRRTAKAIGGRLHVCSALGRGTVASLVLPSNLVEATPGPLH
jgi:signal transduction histidine kinase